MMAPTERARDALHAIPADLPREDWHRVGRAAIAAGLSVDDVVEWSSNASNFKSEQDVRAAFRTITPNGGTTERALFREAFDSGWQDPNKMPDRVAVNRVQTRTAGKGPPRPPKPPQAVATGRDGGKGASELWGRCSPAPADHPYIVGKAGIPDGLRVVPEGDPLRQAGESWGGALVVPVLRPDGSLSTVQLIASPPLADRLRAKGKQAKQNLAGAHLDGWFTVGEQTEGSTVYLCEGIGQAWACWKAAGAAAVVCFGWGRVRAVAAELRQRDPAARLVLVPDVGKEQKADEIAHEVGAAVARMPDGWAENSDVNDLAQREGFDVLEHLLLSASEPQKPEPTVHPLARYVDLDAEPKAPRFVIPGFIGYGLVIFAGTHGVGKTTTLLPLAMVAAGLHGRGDPLAPKHWRHVVYITEDTEQVRRILAGVVNFGGFSLDVGTVRERLHIVEAHRLEPAYVAEVATTYREQFARTVDGVEVPPLVVMDTKSAVFSIDEENSNSEASAIVSMLKQSFQSLPVWLVGHVAKANMSRSDVAGLALRGASAFEGDANQVLYLTKEGEARYLVRGKTRFEAEWAELQIESKTATTMARDEYGDPQAVTLRWGITLPPEQSRKEAQEQAQEAERKADAAALRDEVRDVIEMAWKGGFPLNREGVKAKVKRNRAEVTDTIENLLAERWLHEVAIPTKERTNPKRAAFLVNLTTEEHEAARRGEGMPPAKLEVPTSWRKPAAPSVPGVAPQEAGKVARASHD